MFHLSSLETTNSDLAAALSAVGIPLRKDTPVRILTGHGGDRHCFFFEAVSPCGNYQTGDLIRAWDDKEWHLQHPEHPFAYIKVAFQNRARLMDYVKKGTPICVVEKAGKLAFLSLAASPEAEQKLFKRLNSHR
jgi:hypothetical protein